MDPTNAPNPYDAQTTAPPVIQDDPNLSAVDWLICILCSGIGCIIGIIRMVQGKANGAKMLGVSILFIVIWTAVRIGLTMAMNSVQN